MAIEIETMLVLSSTHITKQDVELLGYLEDPTVESPIIVYTHRHGWFIPLTEELLKEKQTREFELSEKKLSNAFFSCVNLAHKHLCYWLNLDQDGPVSTNLKTYEW
jgi:hypothetical protein